VGDFLVLLSREFGPVVIRIDLRRFLTLLDHLLEELQ
jgi:hypothetical protein